MSEVARQIAAFTAPVNCLVQASAGFEVQGLGSASDWGTGWGYYIRIRQRAGVGGTVLAVDQSAIKPVTGTRAKYSEFFAATVTSGRYIEVDVCGVGGPGLSSRFWNIESRVEVIKR